eukprot:4790279-Amphidinium_carterae.1
MISDGILKSAIVGVSGICYLYYLKRSNAGLRNVGVAVVNFKVQPIPLDLCRDAPDPRISNENPLEDVGHFV